MLKDFILENFFSILTSLLGGGSLLGWVVERKKRKIQEKQETAEALKTMQEAYNTYTEDSLKRYELLKEDVFYLKNQLQEISKQLQEERVKYEDLKSRYDSLERDYLDCKEED